uniref:Immunoglobulin domain-containing protein n=1 Tax=Acanthochromis polyacanthus TaxID=80966 RepID=A0A3Q1EP95_9TELE
MHLKYLCVLFDFFLTDSCCDHVTEKESHDGGSVSFSCPYESENQNNLKYFCRGTQPSTCLQQALVTSDNEHNGQFTLTDDKEIRKFTVNISSLTQKDSGSYLCGVHRNSGFDVFSAIKLEVKGFLQTGKILLGQMLIGCHKVKHCKSFIVLFIHSLHATKVQQ